MRLINPFPANNPGHYTPGVISGNTLYISGQLAIDPETRTVAQGTIIEHARQAFANVDAVLKAAGARRDQVVMMRVYIPDVSLWNEANQVCADYFGEHKPARVVVPTTDLHLGSLIEIECMVELS